MLRLGRPSRAAARGNSLLFLLLLLSGLLLSPATLAGDEERSGGADACRAARIGRGGGTAWPQDSQASNNIDVLSYEITLTVNFAARSMSGRCDVGVRSLEEGLTQFALDLVGLTVSAVQEDGVRSASFSQGGGALTITPASPMAAGAERVFNIFYGGTPQAGMYFNTSNDGVCYTFTEPEDSRAWFPCRDIPADKANWSRTHTVVPTGYLVAANGNLEGVTDNGDGTTTFHYAHLYPISTYLVSLAISRYATFTDQTPEGVALKYFVYPSHYDRAVYDFANVPEMVHFYATAYHPYPFPSYGMALAPMGGAMEHQTMTTLGQSLVTGTRRWEPVVAHELAHQWWGDMVTCADWPNIWLNEGFATYFDALFTEAFYGEGEFRQQMAANRQQYFSREPSEGRFPVYDPDYMWGVTVYEKGGWVLHMLRHVLGTDTFIACLQAYADRFQYGVARTEELIDVCQDVSGADLGWFFEQWVYQAGYPVFRYTWASSPDPQGGYLLRLTLKQAQNNAPPVFVMPLEVGVNTASGQAVHRVEIDSALVTAEIETDGPVEEVVIDPRVWALAGWTYVDLTGDIDASGRVDGLDNARLGWSFGAASGGDRWFVPADLNGDGVVDGEDLAILSSHFGEGL